MFAFLSLLVLALACTTGTALDVSWIPADPHGPLPQSTKYRNSLRQLCIQIGDNGGNNLPPEIKAKKPVLTIMCQRLQEDDISQGNGHLYSKQDRKAYPYGSKEGMAARGNNIMLTLFVIGAAWYVMKYRPDLLDNITRYFNGGAGGRGGGQTATPGQTGQQNQRISVQRQATSSQPQQAQQQQQAQRSDADIARARAREQARRAAWESSAANTSLSSSSARAATEEGNTS